ncbi:2-polyprenyl-6-methoxyphenol hydroxylase-like FAD-dependent oxidoreductase [Microbacterium sp. SLBN-154]|uniref:FAD-dependent oxidoreductase n=1 Tax=Microbacterium sp. SLBN-154 TaxID=2768458 RepID=UPI0011522C0A|nr:FAD-dependent oxidoreductase [Microbacterium sp. SLBN-154]TQK18393.1 2-polyprenyl-6-methoxyphenol hydroxylase-like FAD-dependent oxidoreductase [Microbacterium sp. SLBN-154]
MTEGSPVATHHTTCAIVGGGPAGLVLGLLLARDGIEVTVLEKHADFLRDFRGDTVHPATLGLLDDLGLFERFDALPHSKIRRAFFPGREGTAVFADFSRLPVRHPYIAMVPQWDLLDLLAEAAAAEPTFTLLREHEVTAVTRRNGRATGVSFTSPNGDGRLTADLVVGCDGRWSTVRRSVGLPVREMPVGFDVWWYRLTSDRHLDESLLPRVRDGKVAIGIPRRGYVQVAALGPKGTDAAVCTRGIDAFRHEAATLFPELADAVGTIATMDEVEHLDVRLERLRRWHANNVLCIGDAAHAMSPVGGVGINLAIQDAVAAARLLAGPLARGALTRPHGSRVLARVRRRRLPAVVVIQTLQRILHAGVIMPGLRGSPPDPPAWLLRLLHVIPALTVVPAFAIGVGVRPERAPRWARRPGSAAPISREAR